MKLMTAVVVSSALCTTLASAQQTYAFDLSGSVLDTFNYYNPECHYQIYGCDPPSKTVPWYGTLYVGMISASDGTYRGSDITSLEFSTNFVTFATTGQEFGWGPIVSGTVSGGQLTSLTGKFAVPEQFFPGSETVTFGGLSAQYLFLGFHHGDTLDGFASLAAIPEPGTYILMLAGLAGVSLAAFARVGDGRIGRSTTEADSEATSGGQTLDRL